MKKILIQGKGMVGDAPFSNISFHRHKQSDYVNGTVEVTTNKSRGEVG